MLNSKRILILVIFYLSGALINSEAQNASLQNGFTLIKPVSGSTFNAYSTDSVQNSFSVKTNPFLIFSERFQVQFEIPVYKAGAAVFQIGYRNSDILPTTFDDNRRYVEYFNYSTGDTDQVRYSCKGFQIAVGYKHLIRSGWFLEALFFYKQYDYIFASSGHWDSLDYFLTWGVPEPVEKDSFEKVVKGATFLVGKTISKKHFSLDFYGGVGYRFKKRTIAADNGWGLSGYSSMRSNTVEEKQTISLHLGVCLGYIF